MTAYQDERFGTIAKAGMEVIGDVIDTNFSEHPLYKILSSVIGKEKDDNKHLVANTASKITSKLIEYNEVTDVEYEHLKDCSHIAIFHRSGEELYNLDQVQLDRFDIKVEKEK